MNKRTIVVFLLVALMVVGLAIPAFAGNGYGKQINDSCLDASYGQLISAAQKSGHIDKASGAKYFVESGVLEAHFALCG